jgi:histidyl-tRNA synthetase
VGFSIGFERIIDLIDMNRDNNADSVVLVHDALLTSSELSVHTLLEFKSQLISQGKRVRLEKRVKNLTPVLDRARDAGFTSFAFASADMKSVNDLSFKDLA